jgi:CSLREA domain-containing protein
MQTKTSPLSSARTVLSNVTIVLALLVVNLAFAGPADALGLAIEVNTTADNTTRDGLCSLREAITNANKNYQYYSDCTQGISDDGIFFSNSLGTATILLSSSLPAIKDRSGLVIDGGGDITISGGGSYQVFTVETRAPLTLIRLTVTRGRGGVGSKGGGLYNQGGFVTINNSTFHENSAANGGGLYSNGAYLTITNSTFSGNGAGVNTPGDNDGGGVYNDGSSLIITNSTFSQNGAYDEGGGLYIKSGPTTITNSTFSGNGDVFIFGAGIYAASGDLTVTMSTFSNNIANLGGGIFIASGNAMIGNSTFSGNRGSGVQNIGVLILRNSTFSGNTSNIAGGILNQGTLYMHNTILANSITGRDCFTNIGSPVSGSNNLIEADGLSPNACGTALVTADPSLGTLTGSPAYFPLNSNSPAINQGDDAYCVPAPVYNTSQNGLTRPQGAHCEIGSFESPLASLARSSQEQAAELTTEINSLVEAKALSEENGKNLTSILDAFIVTADEGNTASGIEPLNAFIDLTNSLIKNEELDPASGQSLVDKAQAIIDSVNQEKPAEE